MTDTENVQKCREIWDRFDADNSGTMDMQEVNAVITELRNR